MHKATQFQLSHCQVTPQKRFLNRRRGWRGAWVHFGIEFNFALDTSTAASNLRFQWKSLHFACHKMRISCLNLYEKRFILVVDYETIKRSNDGLRKSWKQKKIVWADKDGSVIHRKQRFRVVYFLCCLFALISQRTTRHAPILVQMVCRLTLLE